MKLYQFGKSDEQMKRALTSISYLGQEIAKTNKMAVYDKAFLRQVPPIHEHNEMKLLKLRYLNNKTVPLF